MPMHFRCLRVNLVRTDPSAHSVSYPVNTRGQARLLPSDSDEDENNVILRNAKTLSYTQVFVFFAVIFSFVVFLFRWIIQLHVRERNLTPPLRFLASSHKYLGFQHYFLLHLYNILRVFRLLLRISGKNSARLQMSQQEELHASGCESNKGTEKEERPKNFTTFYYKFHVQAFVF